MITEFASIVEHSFVPNCFHCAIITAVIVLELNVTVVVKVFLYSFTHFVSICTGIDFFYFPLLFHCKCVCVCVCIGNKNEFMKYQHDSVSGTPEVFRRNVR